MEIALQLLIGGTLTAFTGLSSLKMVLAAGSSGVEEKAKALKESWLVFCDDWRKPATHKVRDLGVVMIDYWHFKSGTLPGNIDLIATISVAGLVTAFFVPGWSDVVLRMLDIFEMWLAGGNVQP